MRSFVQWHHERHLSDQKLVDRYFDPQEFSAELQNLPGEFAPPGGALLVGEVDGQIAGCVALRPFRDGSCEMKRMFVRPGFQGLGLGRLLGRAIIEEARRIGYRQMLLDTGPAQYEAQGLYRALGFTRAEPYSALPGELSEWLLFMKLELV